MEQSTFGQKLAAALPSHLACGGEGEKALDKCTLLVGPAACINRVDDNVERRSINEVDESGFVTCGGVWKAGYRFDEFA